MPALIAASSSLIDYVLTVAVSIAAGVAAITSALPQWHVNRRIGGDDCVRQAKHVARLLDAFAIS